MNSLHVLIQAKVESLEAFVEKMRVNGGSNEKNGRRSAIGLRMPFGNGRAEWVS
jgi:hypothetical protein